jgi:hypothetical protein
MKSLIESFKRHWIDFWMSFAPKPAYYYTLDASKDVQKTPCHKEECTCNAEVAAPQASYEEDLLEPAAVQPVAVKESKGVPKLKSLSKLELQVIAKNKGIKLSGKETKQQIITKIARLALFK